MGRHAAPYDESKDLAGNALAPLNPNIPELGSAALVAAERQTVADEALAAVLSVGQETVTVSTALPPGTERYIRADAESLYGGGFNFFGRGITSNGNKSPWRGILQHEADQRKGTPDQLSDEVILFLPAMKQEPVLTEQRVVRQGLRKVTVGGGLVFQNGKGWEPVMMHNPETGIVESAVTIVYGFGIFPESGPASQKYRDFSRRAGNHLITSRQVPQSMAERFRAALADKPSDARVFASALLHESLPEAQAEALWRGTESPIEPPYNDLPDDWRLSIVSPVPSSPTNYMVENIPIHR